MSAIGRYMPSVTHELVIYRKDGDISDLEVNVGWLIITAIRCRSTADILIPAVASVSWDVVAGVEKDFVQASLIEDMPSAGKIGPSTEVTTEMLDWVYDKLPIWRDMSKNQAFKLAITALSTHNHNANLRMTTAALWAGIEALIGVASELSFRVALLVASYLEERGPARLDTYRKV